MCFLFAWRRLILPLPVILKRLEAPLWVFIFGMSLPRPCGAGLRFSGLVGGFGWNLVHQQRWLFLFGGIALRGFSFGSACCGSGGFLFFEILSCLGNCGLFLTIWHKYHDHVSTVELG